MQNNLRTRLTIAFVSLAVALLLLVGLVLGWRSFTIQREQALDLQSQIAQRVSVEVAAFIQERENELRILTELRGLQRIEQKQQLSLLSGLLSYQSAYEELALTDNRGQEELRLSRAGSASADELDDRSGADEFERPKQSGEIYYGPVEFDQVNGEPFITITIPLIDLHTGAFNGVLAAKFRFKAVWDLIASAQVRGSGIVYVVDADGLVVAHRNSSIVLRETRFVPPEKDGFHSGLGGGEVALATARIQFGDQEFSIVAELPASEALTLALNTAYITVGAIVVAIVLAVVAGARVARQITHPIGVLVTTAQAIAAGDLSQQIRITRRDEFGMLASAFSHMTARLKDMIASLQAQSDELTERALEMEASQRVTLAASERTTPDALLDLVVNLIRDQFHLYHVQVYLVDEGQQVAVLRKSTGYAGRRLLQRGHQIPLDRPALVTKAIHEGQPVLVNDTSQDPNFLPNPLLPHTRSELVVPLKLVDKVIGVLDAQDRVPGRFGESTVALFQTMTNQVAFLFENSDLLDSVTEQSEALTIFATQLRTAAEVARQLGSVLDPDLLLQQVVDMMQSRFGLYHAHIYVLETPPGGNGQGPGGELDGKQLTIYAGSGEVGRVLRERRHNIPLNSRKSLVARAARSHEMVVVKDTTLVSDFMPNPLLPQTRSELAVPLIAGDQVLGVLDMQDDRPGRFTESELDTFGTLAGQIGTTLQTAGLFAQVQARFRVSQALAGTQTEDDVLNGMIQAASYYPEARVSIYTLDQGEGGAQGADIIAARDEGFDSGIASSIPIGTRFAASEFPLLQAVLNRKALVSSNLSLDERIDSSVRDMAVRQGVASMAVLPIMVGDDWLGVIAATSQKQGYFDERKLHLYKSLAEQGAMALRTGRLFDETQHTAERLREVDRVKGEFLASMSHELRTPLNSILGFAEVMLMGIDGDLPLGALEDTQAIFDNGQHLLNLINDILDLTKIEAGYLALKLKEVPIESLIETVRDNAVGLVLNKPSVEFVVEVEDAATLPPIHGDELRLTQILNNLISNAVKFTDEGPVTLRAYSERREAGGDSPRDAGTVWVCLEVEDSGIGISEDDLEKVFDRFHQVDSSQARRAGGTGLGLPITRHLVELHGGTIDARSQLGVGSTFRVRLPAFVPEVQAEGEDD